MFFPPNFYCDIISYYCNILLLQRSRPYSPVSFLSSLILSSFLSPLSASLWLVDSIGMHGDVGRCLQGKDKAVISANEAALVPEHKCANISKTTRPCVYMYVCVCAWVCVFACVFVRENRSNIKGQTEVNILNASVMWLLFHVCTVPALQYDHSYQKAKVSFPVL